MFSDLAEYHVCYETSISVMKLQDFLYSTWCKPTKRYQLEVKIGLNMVQENVATYQSISKFWNEISIPEKCILEFSMFLSFKFLWS